MKMNMLNNFKKSEKDYFNREGKMYWVFLKTLQLWLVFKVMWTMFVMFLNLSVMLHSYH